MGTPLRDLEPVWRAWLGQWADQFDDDLPVVFYADDGTDSPDEWADGPHLAVTCDWRDTTSSAPRALVWPVGIPGWADQVSSGGRRSARRAGHRAAAGATHQHPEPMPANHHGGRPWRERMRPQILERDGWTCQLPHCKAAEWLANPPQRDTWFAAAAREWMATQSTTRAIWRDAPKLGRRFHPLSASVDMDPPKSLGGDDTNPDHLRAGHLLCNVSRGNGMRRPGRQQRYASSAPRIAKTNT